MKLLCQTGITDNIFWPQDLFPGLLAEILDLVNIPALFLVFSHPPGKRG